jgi:ABC-type sugar transport system ATPase subunit
MQRCPSLARRAEDTDFAMAAVSLRGVSKTYPASGKSKPAAAVKSVNLEVADGEFVVLVGPSGCGKTTTLRMIAGLEEVSEGEIQIGERVINRVPPKDRNIAMVFQNYALYPHMTVYRNMAFGLELRYRSDWWSRAWLAMSQPKLAAEMAENRRGIRPRVEGTAEMLGIKHLLGRKPGQLSGGEKQRVALGRAIVRQPAAFLFDEPLSNLDAQLRGEMRRELKRLHQELRATMIYVTHDQVEAMTLGDRIVVMNKGEVRQVGTPLEVYDRPQDKFVARFVGSPPMNLIEGTIETPGQFRSGSLQLACGFTKPSRITAGIRPEDIHLGAGDLTATVDSTELLGDTTLVHLTVGPEQTRLTSKIRDRASHPPGASVRFDLDRERLHWFDTETEQRIMCQ